MKAHSFKKLKQWKDVQGLSFQKKINRNCNICSKAFFPKTQFDRYCSVCRENSDLLKFSEWLPELDSDFDVKQIA